jgi:hypothetical protein
MHLHTKAPRTRSVLLATGVLAVGISSLAIAGTGDSLREGLRNGTSTRETQVISNIGSTTTATGGYATRQSNLSSSGGAAVYGCRSAAGGSAATPKPQNPCLRANNLSTGLAFEFQASKGTIGGLFSVGSGGDGVKPFTTNATGVASGLNADEVDGLSAGEIIAAARTKAALDADTLDGRDAADLETRWVLVGLGGQIEAQSGGFTVVTAYPQGDPAGTSPARHNVYIDSGEDLSDNGLNATIALQNQVDQGATAVNNGTVVGADANPEFSGEIATAKCLTPGLVACAPAGTASSNVFVVSPRNSDGSGTVPGERKRFYVSITG